jgi:hypothetical protein
MNFSNIVIEFDSFFPYVRLSLFAHCYQISYCNQSPK